MEPDFSISNCVEWHSDKFEEIKSLKSSFFDFFILLQDDTSNSKKLLHILRKAHFLGSYSRWFH